MTILFRDLRSFIVRTLIATATVVVAPAAAQLNPSFDHTTTGFQLVGAHATLQCDSCHQAGLPTKGTPRFCNTCHLQGGGRAATFQPPTHIPVPLTISCDTCHNQIRFIPALMTHTNDMLGQCNRCHNGLQAPGKSAMHLPTTQSCDACHTTSRFLPPKVMVHDASSVGRCSICHDGRVAVGKSATHAPTNLQCDTCHTSTVTFRNAQYLHDASTWGRCSTCHNGQTAKGRLPSHIPTNAQCDTCHTSQSSFLVRTMNHTGLNGQCSTCHSGAYLSQNAQAKPATHVQTTAQCDSCHTSTASWATSAFNHTSAAPPVANRCRDCHIPGGGGLSQLPSHIPTTAQCDRCHNNTAAFKPAVMSHANTAGPAATIGSGSCATCHGGSYLSVNALSSPV